MISRCLEPRLSEDKIFTATKGQEKKAVSGRTLSTKEYTKKCIPSPCVVLSLYDMSLQKLLAAVVDVSWFFFE